VNREAFKKLNSISKNEQSQKNKAFATKNEISQLTIRAMTRIKRDVSTAIAQITQQKIADTFTQKRQMINFESNISLKNRENQS
jgi:hypothetical protein